jgi:hypothetical protein
MYNLLTSYYFSILIDVLHEKFGLKHYNIIAIFFQQPKQIFQTIKIDGFVKSEAHSPFTGLLSELRLFYDLTDFNNLCKYFFQIY